MEYIIHLTDKCNLRCKYCYENKKEKDIKIEYIKDLIDYETDQKNKYSVISFYGGEPLLKKEMIKETINYINSKKSKTVFYYSMTTNGTLIDDEFIKYMKDNNFINIGYSIDGDKKSQDLNRITINGISSFDKVLENAKKILKEFKNTVAMVVVTKNNIEYLDENVKFLISIGFKYINLQFNYMDNWVDDDLKIIKEQYYKVSEIYADEIIKENDVSIALFDDKIRTHVEEGYNCNKECKMGMKTINVGTDGNFYPCMQFVGDNSFIIGNCKNGIDIEKRKELLLNSGKENEICANCSINKRCKHTCSCKNYMTTNNVNGLAPIVCETEKIIIEVADKMAEKLYKLNSKLFIQKYYNKDYDLLKQIINSRS